MYPQVFGKYVLERELSRGGMARVVLATLRGAGGFEKKLVVKQIRDELAYDQQFIRRFVEEAKTTVALSHPNIVPVYELGVEQGTYFLAMELVEGLSIAELLRGRDDGGRCVLSPEEGAYVGVEVCRALEYAHRRMKVVHRDITPRNVMIDEEGQVKLIDFGIAAPALVAGHEILGSPGHMAPEQVDGGELGPPTDIFALAVLLIEAWTGAAPFRRATPEECAAAVRDPHPRPSDFDPRLLPLDAAIARAMDVDPRRRQQEAGDLARVLRTFLQGVDVSDVARALGDRVRDLRAEGGDDAPPSRVSGPRASATSVGELGTKTFAARDEALSWSSIPASQRARAVDPADDPEAPSTRPLPDSLPRLVRGTRLEAPTLDVPTPLMVDVDELEAIHARIAATAAPTDGPPQVDVPTVRRGKRPSAETLALEKLDTIATRPLETPVRVARAPRRRPRPPAIRSVVIVAAAAVVAVFGFFALKAREVPLAAHPPVIVPSGTALIPAPTVIAPIPSDTPAPPQAPEPAPAASAPVPPVATPAAASAALAMKASVMLLGEPGTRVQVDGASRGACPLKLTLDPGPHEVRFTFDPTGESLGERVTLKSGDHVTVRATFTGATPTVKILR